MVSQKPRFVVIMAGGRGERFWPESRLKRPKQLLPIVGDEPLLTQAVKRLGDAVPPENVYVITNDEQLEAVREVCPMLPAENIVGEPVGRDTAAAVGLATILVKQRDPEACFAMLPADHVIHDQRGFQEVLKAAFAAAENEDTFVTIGIKPDYPSTGYGYIQQGEQTGEAEGKPVFAVRRFKEKPDEATAEEYVDSGEYYWNGGMFIWRVPVVAKAFAEHTPELWAGLQEIEKGLQASGDLHAVLAEVYPGLKKISVDYALMEKADSVHMIESAFDWDDVGAWPAVARHYEPDASGNVVNGLAATYDAKGNIVFNRDGHVTALIGVEDLIVVQTGDATLVCPKDRAQDIKKLVKEMGERGDTKHLM